MDDREIVRRGYDQLAETYAARRSSDGREVAVLENFLGCLPESALVLDAGCGQGTPVLRRLAEAATGIGVDFSREQLRLAHETVPAASLVQGDMTALPLRAGAFDGVTAFNSLIHVPLAEHRTVVDEFARVLRPGGGILLSEAPEEFERTNADWLDDGVEMTWSMAGMEATREQLRNAGFEVVNEWNAPKQSPEDDPEPPFIFARLVA